MNICEPFIRRPIATILLAVGLTVIGLVAYCLAADRRRAAGRRSDHPESPPSCPAPAPRPWRPSVAAPLERELALISGVTSLSSTSSLGSTAITGRVRSRPQRRRRRAGRPDRDQRRRRAAAEEPAEPADLREGQPGRRAADVDRGDLGRPADREGRRLCRELSGAAESRASPASGWSISTASRSRRSASRSIRRAVAALGLSLEDVRAALVTRDGQRAQGHARRSAAVAHARRHRPAVRCGRVQHGRSSPTATARRCGCATSARPSTASRTSGRRPGSATSGPSSSMSTSSPASTSIETVQLVKDALPELERALPPSVTHAGPGRPHPDHPRFGRATCSSRWRSASAWSCWSCSCSCATLRRHADPERDHPGVAAVHLRGDVSRSATRSTTSR